ncbi:MAG: acyl-CoA dehydrogenase family protein [Desulfobacterales bacterium]
MDFGFTPEQEAFRAEVKAFIEKEVPKKWKDLGYGIWEEDDESWEMTRDWFRKMGQRGYLSLTWPKEYGGQERSHIYQLILDEEMSRAGTPSGIETMITIGWVCPTIMVFGTPEQKEMILPKAAGGELVFCLGYSEPDAGSDLAGVRTTAVEEGDAFIISGQKIWTTIGHRADYCWLVARTDPDAPKHKGLSMFIVDMKTPGIKVNPLINILGFHSFNEVFFDDVRVPKKNLVGQKNMGWYQLAMALDHERSGVGTPAALKRMIDELVHYCKTTRREGKLLADDPVVRKKLAHVALEAEILRMICFRVTSIQAKGNVPNYEASMAKVMTTEIMERTSNIALSILGPYGQLDRGSRRAPLGGMFLRQFLHSPSSVGGGTSEIQRNIIAMRGLGLPRQ